MSVQAMTWAVTQRTGNAGAKAVLMALAFHATASGECFPSQSLLADEAEMDARSVRRHLTLLERAGFIRKEHRQRRNGSRTSDRVYLNLARVQPDILSADQPDTMPARPIQPDNMSGRNESNRTILQVQPDTVSGPPEQSLNSKDKEQMQQPPVDAAAEMLRDLDAFQASVPAARWAAFNAQARLIATGDARGTWTDPRTDGSQVPVEERPPMFRLALAHCLARNVWIDNPMHSALRYVLPVQLTPFPAPTPKYKPAVPGSEDELMELYAPDKPQTGAKRGTGLETIAGEKLRSQEERDNERVDGWSKANPERAEILMQECLEEAREQAGTDRYLRKTIDATARVVYRHRVLAALTPKLAAS